MLAGCRKTSVIPEVELPEPPAIIRVEGVSLDRKNLSLKVGDRVFLVAGITPQSADNKVVSWFSSDVEVVTVDKTGEVNAIAAGTIQIRVTTLDGGFEATCNVTVKQPQEPDPPKDPDPPIDPIDPNPEDPPTEGNIGELEWVMSLDESVLAISGSGDLPDLSVGELPPWNEFRDRITHLVLPANIGRIGDNNFADCTALTVVEIAAAVPPILGSGNFSAVYDDVLVVQDSAAMYAYWGTAAWYEAFGGISVGQVR